MRMAFPPLPLFQPSLTFPQPPIPCQYKQIKSKVGALCLSGPSNKGPVVIALTPSQILHMLFNTVPDSEGDIYPKSSRGLSPLA